MSAELHSKSNTARNSIDTLKRILSGTGWLLLFICFVLYVGEFVKLLYSPRSLDYWWYAFGFHTIFSAPGPLHLYDVAAQRHFVSAFGKPRAYDEYVYPPQFAFLFSWLSLLSVRAGEVVWALMSVVSYIIGFWLLQRLAYQGNNRRFKIQLLALGAMAIPYLSDTVNANSDWLLFLLLTLTFYLRYQQSRPGWAGVLLGVAVVCKVTPLFIVLYLFTKKDWRTVTSSVISASVITLVTLFFTGIVPFHEYVSRFLGFTETSMKNGVAPWNSSFLGVLQYWTGLPPSTANQGTISISFAGFHMGAISIHILFDIYLVVVGAIFLGVYLTARRQADSRYDMALASLSLVLFSPLVELHYLLFLVLPLVLLLGIQADSLAKLNIALGEQGTGTNSEARGLSSGRWGHRLVAAALIAVYFVIEDLLYPLHGCIAMIGLLLLTLASLWLSTPRLRETSP